MDPQRDDRSSSRQGTTREAPAGSRPSRASRTDVVRAQRDRFARWSRRVERLLARARRARASPRAGQDLEALRHKRDRVELKLERLERTPDPEHPDPRLRLDLEDAWRELRDAWSSAVQRFGDAADGD